MAERPEAGREPRYPWLLDGYADKASLDKVLIRSKGFRDTQLAHHDEGGSIDQRPRFVVVLFKERPYAIVDGSVNVSRWSTEICA